MVGVDVGGTYINTKNTGCRRRAPHGDASRCERGAVLGRQATGVRGEGVSVGIEGLRGADPRPGEVEAGDARASLGPLRWFGLLEWRLPQNMFDA